LNYYATRDIIIYYAKLELYIMYNIQICATLLCWSKDANSNF